MRHLTIIFASFTLAACGAKLPGGITIPGGGGSSGGGSSGGGGGGGGGGGSLGTYYASLDHAALRPLFQNAAGDDIYEKAKTDVGRDTLWKSPNPDPTWIKEWGSRDWTNASENAEIMYQAAYNRTWEAACAKESDETLAAHARLTKEHTAELARVDGLTNYYERMAGYVALSGSFEEAATAAGLTPEQMPLGPVGFRVTILQHAVAYHQGSSHKFVAFPWERFGAAAQRTQRDGRTLTGDAAFERQAYCSGASNHGGRALAPFTSIIDTSNAKSRKLAWPTVWGDEQAVAARVKKEREATAATLETRSAARVERVEKAYGVSFPDGEPKLASFTDFKVVSVSGARVKVARTDLEHYSFGCRETTKIDRVEDGKLIYRQECKSGESVYELTAEVAFEELPPGVTLAKGDVLHFAADIDTSKVKKVKDTAARKQTVRTMVLTARHLGRVTRGKEKLTW